MNANTQALHALGQSLWLDNITRDLLDSGTLKRYIDELSVTGLTSNPTIFDHAIKNSTAYDGAIRQKVKEGKSGEPLFFELALEDLSRAADLFRPIWDRTDGVDGWVSLEVSPLLAHDSASTLAAARDLHARANQLVRHLDWFEIEHVLRGQNKEADQLANEAMDKGSGRAPLLSASPTAQRLPQEFEGVVRNGKIELLDGSIPDGTAVQVRVKR